MRSDEDRSSTRDGRVTLEGSVPSWHARNVAVDIARHTSGVVDVEDKLLVGSSTSERSPVPGPRAG